MHILITGGCGFIGSNITQYLLENKVETVTIVDNLSTGKKENIQFLLDKYSNLEFIYGDISNIETCRKVVKNVDIICHQAALGSVPRSIDDPLNSHISNVNGFLNILIAAREKGIKRIVYASSSSVYGDHPELPKHEEKVGSVLSPYAATKKIDEIYANVFTKCYDMECIGLRYFNVFGPRQDPHGPYAAVIPKFIDIMKNDKQPTINGDGTYSRDFTYVDNVVQGNVLALTTNNKKCFGEVFNIGAGGRVTLLELVSNINKYLQKNISPIFGTNRPGDIPHSNASVSKAREMLNYDPKINFEEGIKKTIDHYLVDQHNKDNINYNLLLNRKPIEIDNKETKQFLNGKKILVTGGCGSIGSEIIKQLIKLEVSNICIIDNNEYNLFYLQEYLKDKKVKFYLRDINIYDDINIIFKDFTPDIVFHVAAYKHVPILEDNPYESIKVNILGTKNIADLSMKYNIKKFIFVSTDKAVNPTNIMGASKRVSELYVNTLNKHQKTKYIITRFGNVLGSSGSVVPTFIKKIKQGKNINLTDENITRYFMTIPEAAQLVIKSSYIGTYNNILLFDMGQPVKIKNLALNLIQYFKSNVGINIIGLRKGEKMYEELYYEKEKVEKTEEPLILKLKSDTVSTDFINVYNVLIHDYKKMNINELKHCIKKIIPEYLF